MAEHEANEQEREVAFRAFVEDRTATWHGAAASPTAEPAESFQGRDDVSVVVAAMEPAELEAYEAGTAEEAVSAFTRAAARLATTGAAAPPAEELPAEASPEEAEDAWIGADGEPSLSWYRWSLNASAAEKAQAEEEWRAEIGDPNATFEWPTLNTIPRSVWWALHSENLKERMAKGNRIF